MQDFENLIVWRKAHDLTLAVYKASASFPAEERFGLTSQLRRATSSIATNIAEGCGRGGNNDFARFLQIALGSASEAKYLMLLTTDLGYLPRELHVDFRSRINEIMRMLTALQSRTRATLRVVQQRTPRSADQENRNEPWE
ncbi:MAG: four helix bundle protein [Candidatus Sumerlaeia bacterium]|nr:four helix bundle protein [Candidatus Sumerlaeia bacterium]